MVHRASCFASSPTPGLCAKDRVLAVSGVHKEVLEAIAVHKGKRVAPDPRGNADEKGAHGLQERKRSGWMSDGKRSAMDASWKAGDG